MDVIRKIAHNEMVEMNTPVQITWHDGKSKMRGDFSPVKNYTKADRYPIPMIHYALDKQAKAKYITKMDCMNVTGPLVEIQEWPGTQQSGNSLGRLQKK
ncbi:hypothetical protein O181_078486 [Austropuccinia psidii MF-1]|uniref:Uncharacterized protein n=1 Tax=Austropuccinia psidii MF-1 TaxID=1389203 RepID=A0A9Q3FED8_9BASI|nr:hypothetical protein [Austropuccinia psidii MF-1]